MENYSGRRLWHCALLLAVLLAAPAWGRAGGGGSYSGGSHSSGSHSSSTHSSSSHDSSGSHAAGTSASSYNSYSYGNSATGPTQPMTPAQQRLMIAVLVALLLLYLAYRIFLARPRQDGDAPDRERIVPSAPAPAVQDESGMQRQLGSLRQRDPGFDERAFLERIASAFRQIQQAWSGQDLAPVRAFISDGVMERFSIQLEMQQADGLRNEVSAVNVLDARIVEVESDAHFDTLHVRIHANAVDREIVVADGAAAAGAAQHSDFVEVWSFLRRPGAHTLARPGPIEGCCPSCGAQLRIADAAQCASCKSWVNSGEYDWVLSEITQECEWAVRGSGEAVPGYAALARRDPMLNTQFLEDRASVAFWRWQQAMAQGKSAAMRCVATDGWCAEWDADPVAREYRFREVGVGAVEVLAFEPGQPFNLAHVGIKWSGDQYSAGAGRGAPHFNSLRQHVLVLGRRDGAGTDPGRGLNSSRCPNCGAPPATRELAACSYCATPFNDGSRQWVVMQLLPSRLWRAPQPVAADAPSTEPAWSGRLSSTDALAVMVAGMSAHGPLTPDEVDSLERFAGRRRMIPGTVQGMIDAARDGHLELPRPATPEQAQAALDGLIELSLADGKLEPNELKLILAYAARAGIAQDEVTRRLKARRAQPPPAAHPLSIVSQ